MLRYLWTVLINCFYLFIVLFVLNKLNQRPEAIVVAVLGLSYVAMRSHAIGQMVSNVTAFVQLHEQFFYIRKLLDDTHLDAVYADFKKQCEAAEPAAYGRIYIECFFLFLISLSCLLVLFTSLSRT